ncbi:hypothetical protein T439DRAFT_328506 [Meredithblackwellia eburnea MCA 4105]
MIASTTTKASPEAVVFPFSFPPPLPPPSLQLQPALAPSAPPGPHPLDAATNAVSSKSSCGDSDEDMEGSEDLTVALEERIVEKEAERAGKATLDELLMDSENDEEHHGEDGDEKEDDYSRPPSTDMSATTSRERRTESEVSSESSLSEPLEWANESNSQAGPSPSKRNSNRFNSPLPKRLQDNNEASSPLTDLNDEDSIPVKKKGRPPNRKAAYEGDDLAESEPSKKKAKKGAKVPKSPASTSKPRKSILKSTATPKPKANVECGRGVVYPPETESPANPWTWRLQDASCYSKVYGTFPLCRDCTGRQAGFVCSFLGIRWFKRYPSGALFCPTFRSTDIEPEIPKFPTNFNEPFLPTHAAVLKTACATNLLPTLRVELDHSQQSTCIRVHQEISARSTCDTCLHTILSGSWFCTICGRDFCFACKSALERVEREDAKALADGLSDSDRRKRLSEEDRRLRKCFKNFPHASKDLVPFTRFKPEELKRIVGAMDAWLVEHPNIEYPGVEMTATMEVDEDEKPLASALRLADAADRYDDDDISALYSPSAGHNLESEDISLRYMVVPSLAPHHPVEASILEENANISAEEKEEQVCRRMEERVKREAVERPLFHRLWGKGETMVVPVAETENSELDWSPAYFIEKYGDEPCKIGSNRTSFVVDSTVGDFFQGFGKIKDRKDSLKIKDWPVSTDFRDSYPDLFHDYIKSLPAGHVTRRDGVLNIAAHTPTNANPPDLGPKGYFSETSDDGPGGQGSTKLHTVNLMLWAGTMPDGTPGTAAWDLFRAEDSDKIREFLYELIAEERGITVEQARAKNDDPIHLQTFFLDKELRASLLAKKGVKSWRIYQRPGECVFIPAGCAHQVCNFADCIKVASDFVSIENVNRCWKVTDEFREQTKDKTLWRSDILQLKSQLLWAWKSCERFDDISEPAPAQTIPSRSPSLSLPAQNVSPELELGKL